VAIGRLGPMAYQSLYRSYRPRRFSEVRGQDHVVRALRNAVREGRVGHAYLFSGPRGTGKTSTARILAKALNCENLQDGEPDCTCESCLAIDAGTSYDLQELDAASNNGVEAVRDLIGKVALGSPGRTKVYILDEVHMLSTAASNALLKTLEEPPGHVVFVLATTDPHKVLPTIRSRTQHYEFHLIPAEVLAEHVAWVAHDAGLDVDQEAVDYVLRQGGGSARDTLSALDQVVAAGGVLEGDEPVDALLDAVVAADTGAALAAVADGVSTGRDPRVLGEALLARLRDVFLLRMRSSVDHLPDAEQARVSAWADQLGDRATTRALELVGDALLEMRQAPDARIPLEVALVKITQPATDSSVAALAERIDRLERALAGGAAPAAVAPASPAAGAPPAAAPPPDDPTAGVSPPSTGEDAPSGAAAARATLKAQRSGPGGRAPSPPPPRPSAKASEPPSPPAKPAASPPAKPAASPPAPDEPASAPKASDASGPTPRAAPPTAQEPAPASPAASTDAGSSITLDQLVTAWPQIHGGLKAVVRGRFSDGGFTAVDGDAATFAVRSEIMRGKCEEKRGEVESALGAHFGRPLSLALVVDTHGGGSRADAGDASDGSASAVDDADVGDVHALEDAPDGPSSSVDALTQAFPGAQLMEPES